MNNGKERTNGGTPTKDKSSSPKDSSNSPEGLSLRNSKNPDAPKKNLTEPWQKKMAEEDLELKRDRQNFDKEFRTKELDHLGAIISSIKTLSDSLKMLVERQVINVDVQSKRPRLDSDDSDNID
jgi:hypothetical protein